MISSINFLTRFILSTILFISSSAFFISDKRFTDPPGPDAPKIFFPGIISDGLPNRDMAISPKKDEIFYTVQQRGGGISAIMSMKYVNGKWTSPEVAPFSGIYNDLEAAFSPDGNEIYFSSKRMIADTLSKNYDLYKVSRTKSGWSVPERLPSTVNTSEDEFYPSVSKTGNLYFTRNVGENKEDIMLARWKEGTYQQPESLPEAINSKGFEFNAYVDPSEKFIIFTGFRRKDDRGGGDLYISVKNAKNEWQPAENLGENINSTTLDYCPFMMPGENYLFFTSSRNVNKQPFTSSKNKKQIDQLLNSAGNGFDDIYWIEFKVPEIR